MGKKINKKTLDSSFRGNDKARQVRLSYGEYTLDQAKFDKLLGVADKHEQTTLKVLYNAVIKCINDLNSSSSAITVKHWEKTRNSYEQYSDELWKKYFSPPPDEKNPAYKTILDVVGRINKMGFRLSKSSAYNHGDKGLLRPDSDGIFTQDIIDKYIVRANLKRKDGSKKEALEKGNAERQNAETRRINAQAEREELKLRRERGLYIPKESMERELSYRAMVFKMDGDSFCRSEAGAIIELIIERLEQTTREKHPEHEALIAEMIKEAITFMKDKIPDLQEFLLERFHKWLARYAADREFTVPVPEAAEMISDIDDENSENEEF